jgi:hypothetical protein
VAALKAALATERERVADLRVEHDGRGLRAWLRRLLAA